MCLILYSHVQLQWMGRELIANEQGGPLAQLKVTPGQPSLHQTLGAIVVHAAAILQWRQRVDILKPFTNMLNNPVALVVSIHIWYIESNWCINILILHYLRMLIFQQCLKTPLLKLEEQ